MAYTTIDDPSKYFQIALYTGNAGTNNIVNDGNSDLQPDWVWIKNRSTGGKDHGLFDSTRGTTKQLNSNNNNAENTVSTSLTAFNSDGFTLGADGGPNANSDSHVAWQWKANGGTTSTNSSGSSNSTVQANTTAGFSIVKRTGTGSAGATYGHGLGAVPDVIINKGLNSNEWYSYFKAIGGGTHWIDLSGTGGSITEGNDNTLSYTKIGRQVFISGRIYISAISSPTGDLTISGLPFANQAASETAEKTYIAVIPHNWTYDADGLWWEISAGASNGPVQRQKTGVIHGNKLAASAVIAGSYLVITGSYHASV